MFLLIPFRNYYFADCRFWCSWEELDTIDIDRIIRYSYPIRRLDTAAKSNNIPSIYFSCGFLQSVFYLYKLPFETVRDLVTNETPISSINTKVCGLQFGHLTDKQKSDLRYFMQTHTIGRARPRS